MVETTNLPKSGYTSNTASHYLLNAGAWVKNLKWEKTGNKWTYDLIGATSEGSKLTMKNTYRQVPVDGVMTAPVGSDLIEETEGTFELNMIEHTLENLKMTLMADAKTSDGTQYPADYTVIKPRGKVQTDDYIKDMAYVGTISGSDKPIIIIIDYAICTSGLELEPKDKSEAVYTAVFEARTGPENIETQALPITILFPKIDAATPAVAPMAANVKVDGAPEVKADETDKTTKGATK